MVVESAERFGLAHYTSRQSWTRFGTVILHLLTSYKLSSEGRKRINVITSTNDGFIIAEEDLKIRGYGDIDGTRQTDYRLSLKLRV